MISKAPLKCSFELFCVIAMLTFDVSAPPVALTMAGRIDGPPLLNVLVKLCFFILPSMLTFVNCGFFLETYPLLLHSEDNKRLPSNN